MDDASTGIDFVGTITSAFTTVANDCMSAIASVLPVVLPVMGAVVVIGLAVGIFKRFVQ